MKNHHGYCVMGLVAVLSACSSEVDPAAPQPDRATVVTATPVQTQPTSTPQRAADTDMTQASAATATAQIFIDPATGQPRAPTANELASQTTKRAQITSASSKSRPAVKVTALPNGVTEYDLGEAALVEETACLQTDGSFGACTVAQQQELRAKAQQRP